ncbi:MAG: butyrate kinase [Candidatus Latescibacteria bacterium]|nr:butyrate kinase [Candidatus Latescibacterota bacterium]
MKTLLLRKMPPLEIFRRLLGAPLAERLAEAGYRILVINPGSTSTKVAYFEGIEKRADFEVHLDPDQEDSPESRAELIRGWLAQTGIDLSRLDGIASRGGVLKPVPSGVYPISDALLEDLAHPRLKHASSLGVPIALALRERCARGTPVVITDPPMIDEVEIESRMTGLREFKTDGTAAHYLNHRAVLRLSAWEFGIDPDEASVVSAHLGGGISVIRFHRGKAVRVINAFSGLPSMNRSGALPIHDLLLALEGHHVALDELSRGVFREGGLLSLAGTNDFKTLLDFREHGATRAQADKINLLLRFFAQKISEGILSCAAGWGRPDYVVITGGLSRSRELADRIEERVGGLLPVVRLPGSVEQESLAAGMARALLEPDSLRRYEEERDMLAAYRQYENRLMDQPVFRKPVMRRRPGSPIRSLEELIQATRSQVNRHFLPTIAIAGSDNDDALEAARRATEEGEFKIARFMLVGDITATRKMAAKVGLDLRRGDFELVEADDPVARCLELYAEDRCQVLMKGSVKTEELLAPVFRWLKERGRLHEGALFSHVAVFQRSEQGKLLLLSDAGINVDPDQDKKRRILENALVVARSLNLPRPKVAVISAIEKVNPRIESSVEAAEIARGFAERKDCLVEGPLSFDVAVDAAIAEEKGYHGEIRGTADILIMPGIDAGNAVYKSLTVSSGLNAAGVIVGCEIPVVLTSRGDTALTKLSSLALSLRLYFQGRAERVNSGT